MPEPIRILTFADYYLPAYKAGGPIRSLANMADQLGPEFEFLVVTRDRDLGDSAAFPEVVPNRWQVVGNARVLYLSRGKQNASGIAGVIRSTPHRILYLNSFFSPKFTILPLLLRRLGRVPERPVVLAPRGELSPDALELKGTKKRIYLALSGLLGLHRGIVWQASTGLEREEIRSVFGGESTVVVAQDVPTQPQHPVNGDRGEGKVAGRLRMVFLSRISPKKNLYGAIEILREVEGDVRFDIYGPLEDLQYWDRCQASARRLPPNVEVRYRGEVPPQQVSSVLRRYDLFFLPTLGENFGHAILEALVAGCPVLISDRTPWRDLEQLGIGWALPLDRPDLFRSVIHACLAMDEATHRAAVTRATEHGLQRSHDAAVIEQNRSLLRGAAQWRPEPTPAQA
jgi:glycosyltransferase involved in cell wall biosynthesis